MATTAGKKLIDLKCPSMSTNELCNLQLVQHVFLHKARYYFIKLLDPGRFVTFSVIITMCYHHSRDMENSRGCAPISRDIQIPGLFDDLVITNSGILKNHRMYFMLIFGMNSLMLHCI